MSSLILSIDLRQIYYFILFYFILNNGAMDKWWMVIWCNGDIKNRTGHLLSHKYWICLFVLLSNTTFLLIIKNKKTLISYYNTSFLVVIFRNGKTDFFLIILSIIATFSPSESCRCCRCWRLVFGALLSKLLSLESCCCGCFVVVSSGVPYYDCVRRLLHLFVGGVLSLLLAVASPQSKLTYTFVSKFKQVIGTKS